MKAVKATPQEKQIGTHLWARRMDARKNTQKQKRLFDPTERYFDNDAKFSKDDSKNGHA